MIAVELGGWLAASAAGFAAARVRRTTAGRMETIARACHELRGPLTAARLGLDYGAGNGQLTPARLRAIDLELGRAALALDDLEAVRTPPAWSRPPEPIDLGQLVSDSVEAWRPSAAARGVELRGSWSGRSATVWGDRLRLAQVTGNLISNAIEHGGGVVEVHGWVVVASESVVEAPGFLGDMRGRDGRTTARIEVTDTGPGLPAPIALLTRDARGGRGRRGRGLAISTAIATEHGGLLAAAPSVRGARLVLELPIGKSGVVPGGGTADVDAPA
ncbi:MAG TPA: HAMP domain-containing sensor histidine kinase [Solirubrobacteraceae bacterium]|nr:HAMP domain-containing sensor histidine kinase [Solirubrobacteraceae bacterium]